MHLRWNFGFGLVCFFWSLLGFSQESGYMLSVKENLVSDSLVWVSLPECWSVIVLSKDQCSNCSNNLWLIIDAAKEAGRTPIICRVVDAELMTCKQDELDFRELYDDITFYFLKDKSLNFKVAEEWFQNSFHTTPYLVINEHEELLEFQSTSLIDDYGKPKIDYRLISSCD